jgi:glycosyltransferase involved in cell wall biosynthesis
MAKQLVLAGHTVHMITSWRGETDQNGWWGEEIDGIHVHWLPVNYNNKMGFFRRIAAFLKFALRAGTKAVSIGGDVVVATSTPLTIAIPGVFAGRRMRVPMVFEVRDLWPAIPIALNAIRSPMTIALAKMLERFAYRNSAQIIALSPGMAEGVRNCGYPDEKIHVIPNCSDIDLFAPDDEGAARFRALHPELGAGPIVLYAGTFGLINGVSYLPKLASAMQECCPDVRFVAIGAGAEVELVRKTAEKLGVLNDNFFMYPAIPKLDLVDAFRSASISTSLVIDLPETWHNSANKFFDTLASGTAIAINYQGWQAEIIEAEEIGIVLSANPEMAAIQLAKLLDDQTRLDRLAKNALQLAKSQFDRNQLGREFIEVIERAVKNW